MKKLIFLLLIGYGIHYWYGQQEAAPVAVAAQINANGFIRLPLHTGAAPGVVYVMAALNCTRDAARRADDLAFELQRRGVLVQRISGVSFELTPSPSLEQIQQQRRELNAVMTGIPPIVLINGMARANPDLDSVLAEIDRQRL